jgi:hypothetical protein
MKAWSLEELALLWRHSNEVAEITGRSIEEVGDKRLQTNIERNGWDVNDPGGRMYDGFTGSNTPADQRDLWRTPPALFASLDAEFASNWMPPRRRITRCAGSSSQPSRTRWKRHGLIT